MNSDDRSCISISFDFGACRLFVSALDSPSVIHAHRLSEKNFDRAQIASLASRNEVLVVSPSRQVLPDLLSEIKAQGVPFATIGDLREIVKDK